MLTRLLPRGGARASSTSDERLSLAAIVDASRIVDGSVAAGLIEATRVVAPATAPRRPPTSVDAREVPWYLRLYQSATFAETGMTIPERHLLVLSEARLAGHGCVVAQSGASHVMIRDSAFELLHFHRGVPPGFARGETGRLTLPARIDRRIEPRCLVLKRWWSPNFGHWLIDQAMALSFLVRRGALDTKHIVVHRVEYPLLREIVRQTIAAILPDAVVHEHPDDEIWQFRETAWLMPLHLPRLFPRWHVPPLLRSCTQPPLVAVPAALDSLRTHLLAAPVPATVLPRRLHVLRPNVTWRKLMNEAEIAAVAARHGFTPVVPETLPMAEQAALFAGAEAVLGVKGAAMTNILFAAPSCKLILLSPADFIDQFYWNIASLRGIAYHELFGKIVAQGKVAGHNAFRIDAVRAEAMIAAALAGSGAPKARPKRP
jgi:capsular polysaccharide biosynthesis protein